MLRPERVDRCHRRRSAGVDVDVELAEAGLQSRVVAESRPDLHEFARRRRQKCRCAAPIQGRPLLRRALAGASGPLVRIRPGV